MFEGYSISNAGKATISGFKIDFSGRLLRNALTLTGGYGQTKAKPLYNYFYVGSIVLASVISIDIAINLIDGMFALMAIPTMISAILLSPKVMAETRRYFSKLQAYYYFIKL